MLIVTGANGFIGSVLVEELNLKGFTDIVCVDSVSPEKRAQPLSKSNYENFVTSQDFLSAIKSNDLYESAKCIFHMGACSSTTEMDRDFLRENNTEYTKSLFEFCQKNEIPFIYASSAAVYGGGEHGFDDKIPAKTYTALNPYGESKLNFDIWSETQTDTDTKWYGLRFFNVYGPNEYHKEAMASLVFKASQQIRDSEKLKLFRSHNPNYKDGEQLRDFVYVKDITRWMIELYERDNINSGIYNLGYGEARSWLDLAKAVFENMDIPMEIEWIDIPENIRNQYQYYTKADIGKLKSQGLSEPQWPLEKGITDYLQNYLKALL